MKSLIYRTLFVLSLTGLLFAPATFATEEGVSEVENQTHLFERQGDDGGLAPLFMTPNSFTGESCSGACNCTTCVCTGTLSCCASGCGDCWAVADLFGCGGGTQE